MTLTKQNPARASSRPQADRLPRIPSLLWVLTLLTIVGRGLLEITIGKTLAYAAQATIFGLLTLVLLIRFRHHAAPNRGWGALLWWLLLIASLLSITASEPTAGAQSAITYAAVMMFFGTALLINTSVRVVPQNPHVIGIGLVIANSASIVVALLQQFAGLTLFPGTDLGTLRTQARPSAMTGSFLHYPIAVALISLALIGIYVARRNLIYLGVGSAGLVAVVVSFSRSGMVIIGIALLYALLTSGSTRWFLRVILAVPLLATILFTALPTDAYVNRFLSIFDSDGAGNVGRIDAWRAIIDLWATSPLIIGQHAGQYTNITSNLAPAGAIASPESGVLQVLISLGGLGLIAYYGLMVRAVRITTNDNPWFRAALVAGIVQSFFYQSIEVLPFMAVFSLLPAISQAVSTKAPKHLDLEPSIERARPLA